MKHASIYITESIAKRSETQAFRRYTEFKQRQGVSDMEKIKEDFMTFRNALRTDIISLRTVNRNVKPVIDGGKYEEGCTRLLLNRELTNAENIHILDNIITIILKNSELYNQYDKNLNDLSLKELKSQFQDTLQQISDDEHDKVEKMNYGSQSSSYDIIPINSFKEASEYYPLCIHKSFSNNNNNKPEWCLTYGGEHFDMYNGDGANQIYFCIRKDIKKDDEPIQGEGHPQDEYGNSMISVIVDEEGELVYSTSRWNHELEGSDKAYSVVDISRIVGVDFYKTFLPNQNFKNALENALNLYKQTNKIYVFDDYDDIPYFPYIKRVKIYNKQNFLNIREKKILSDTWFDYVYDFNKTEKLSCVILKKKGENIIDLNGKILSDIWFDEIKPFHNGFASVYVKDKGWNAINTNGELVSDIWFDFIKIFSNGFAEVYINDKGWNFINTNGEIISDIWFDDIEWFEKDGFAKVKLKDKGWNFINTNGEFVSDAWFKYLDFLGYGGIIAIENKNQKCNILNSNKEPISNIWFDNIDLNSINKENIIVTLNSTEYILNFNGDLYDKNNNFIKNVSFNENNEEITNESLRRNDNIFINEVLDLNKRIKKLYE